jgi:hypothetical protein
VGSTPLPISVTVCVLLVFVRFVRVRLCFLVHLLVINLFGLLLVVLVCRLYLELVRKPFSLSTTLDFRLASDSFPYSAPTSHLVGRSA